MRLALLLVLVAATASADRKKASDKFTQAAREAFEAAVAADAKGNLPEALGLYQKAYGIAPHPSTIYNIADVQRRMSRWTDAAKSYEIYLAMSPHAADRATVEATIEKMASTPGRLFVKTSGATDPESIDLKTAYVIVDGTIVIKPGTAPEPRPEIGNQEALAIDVGPGDHDVDVVTPLTHAWRLCKVDPGGRGFCQVTAKPRIDGHLVVSGVSRSLSFKPAIGDESIANKRVELPAGKLRLLVRDHSYECAPITVDVPGGNDVAYVYAASDDVDGVPRCRKLDYTRHRLSF